MLNKDYKDMLECLFEEKVGFLLGRQEHAYANRKVVTVEGMQVPVVYRPVLATQQVPRSARR